MSRSPGLTGRNCFRLQVCEELQRRRPPRKIEGVGAAAFARYCQGSQGGSPEILVERANAAVANDIERTRNRIGGDRKAAGKRLQNDQAKRIGAARKDEDVGRGVERGERAVVAAPEEMRPRELPPQRRQ